MEVAQSKLADLMREYACKDILIRRAVGAVLGATVADAATRPMHWVYSEERMKETVGSSTTPEFWPVNCSPFYSLPLGRRSCYNDEALTMLQSLPSTLSEVFKKDAYVNQLRDRFSPESDYAMALAARKEKYDSSQRYKEREPVVGPWENQSIQCFLEKDAAGESTTGILDVHEADGFISVIPLIARLAMYNNGSALSPDSIVLIESFIKVLSASDVAVNHAVVMTRVLYDLISNTNQMTNDSISRSLTRDIVSRAVSASALPPVEGEFSAVLDYLSSIDSKENVKNDSNNVLFADGFVEAISSFGKACSFPGTFQGAMLTTLYSSSFVEGVRRNIVAGGCNCSRANTAGACMGAIYGIGGESGIPLEWILQTDVGTAVFEMAMEKLTPGE